MSHLYQAVDQLEGSAPAEVSDEEERVVCPVCGEIFNQSSYKVIVRAFVTQQPVPKAMEEQGQLDWKDGEAPQEKLHKSEVANEPDVNTQEPASLNIPVEISTQIETDELEDEVIHDFVEEVCTVTTEPSQGTEPIEMES